jgi:putative transposase
LHRASGAGLAQLRALESAQAGGGRPAIDLSRGTAAEAEQHLAELEGKWKTYPSVSQVWRRNWARITPFFNYPPDIRRAIYTTNSVESLNRSLRKIIKTRGGFPNEDAALKLLFLALRQAAKKWTMPTHHWREALNYFTILWRNGCRPWRELRNERASRFYRDGLGKGKCPLPECPIPETNTWSFTQNSGHT